MKLWKIVFVLSSLFIVNSINAEHYLPKSPADGSDGKVAVVTEKTNSEERSELIPFDGILQLSCRLTENSTDGYQHVETTHAWLSTASYTCTFSASCYGRYSAGILNSLQHLPLYLHHRRLRI